MPQPSHEEVHIDQALTNMSLAYIQSQDIFIASKVFPIVPVDHKSDKYWIWDKADWFRDEAQLRGDSQESAGGGMHLSTDSFNCDVWAFHKDVGHLTAANADRQLNMERAAVKFVTQRMLLREEKQWVADYFTTSVWANDWAGIASGVPTSTQFIQWNDYAASNPLGDIERARLRILTTTGFLPNTLVLGYEVFSILKNHPDIVDRIKYTTDAVVTRQIMAKYFEVENLYVAMAVQNTAQEGQTASYSLLHGKQALLAYVSPTPGLEEASAGYIYSWTGVSQGLGATIGTSSIYIPTKKTWRYESEIAFDDKVVASDLAVFFATAVA